MPFISRKKLDDLRMQVKGYYGDEAANATNAYFQRIAAAMRGVKLPPFINNITRQDIFPGPVGTSPTCPGQL